MLKLLQINTNRSRDALDITIATARNLDIDLILISEPNKKKLDENKEWFRDPREDSAIVILNKEIRVSKQGYGDGYTYVTTSDFTIFSCYSSGNRELCHLEDMLDEISVHIRRSNNKCIVAGDFNCKSPLWGMKKTDARGAIMEEWIAQMDLCILNEGDKPTFQCENYESILDLTLATHDVKREINEWKVLGEESLSDHNFIVVSIEKQQGIPEKRVQQLGWHIKNIDEAKVAEASCKLTWEEDITAGKFSDALKEICDKTLARKKKVHGLKPVYWWNSEIAAKRKECVQKRRSYSRATKKNSNLLVTVRLWTVYQNSRKDLRNEIKKAKRLSWRKLIDEVEKDIWGDGYKIAMKCTIGFPQKNRLTIDAMIEVAKQLFPPSVTTQRPVTAEDDIPETMLSETETVIDICDKNVSDNNVIFLDFTVEELEEASSKLKVKKAPGPDMIPPEILKLISKGNSQYVLRIYNKLAKDATFPSIWKKANLVLLPKGNSAIENPSSYRPICLLDVEGKLYELLLAARLDKEIEKTGGLSENQYGFRSGRQTIHAIQRVIETAKEAESYSWKYRRICVVIMLDVKNAFNCASWEHILEALRKRGVDKSLYKIIRSYLSERSIILTSQDRKSELTVNRGVPQGSILGPKLWNILYDDLFRISLPEGVSLVGFADDVAMLVVAKTEEAIMMNGNRALQRVSDWMVSKHLELAPQKSEAVILTKKRKLGPIEFSLNGNTIQPVGAIKYLGVWLDTKLTFSEHINRIVEKTSKTVRALSSIMPNINGPKSSKRRVLCSVVNSKLLYAAPVWYTAMENKKLAKKLLSLQRCMAIRVCSAYRTISTAAVGVIAGTPPIDLMAKERQEIFNGKTKNEARTNLAESWQKRWEQENTGRWTYALLPNIEQWLTRPYGEADYYLTQALSGHGNFNKYLYDKGKRDTPKCKYCSEEDDVKHTLIECVRWDEIREEHYKVTGCIFNMNYLQSNLTAEEKEWHEMYRTIREIMTTKEKEQ